MKCSKGLFKEHDFNARKCILDRQRQLLKEIDHKLSAEIVKKVSDRQGKEICPWIHSFG